MDTKLKLERALKAVYDFRVEYLKRHVPSADMNLALEPFMTWHRIFNFDETNITFLPQDVAQQTYTVGICTDALGNVFMLLLGFQETAKLQNPIQLCAGHLIFEAYNDTHWKNGILHPVYLEALFATFPACSCGNPECTTFCFLFDNFT